MGKNLLENWKQLFLKKVSNIKGLTFRTQIKTPTKCSLNLRPSLFTWSYTWNWVEKRAIVSLRFIIRIQTSLLPRCLKRPCSWLTILAESLIRPIRTLLHSIASQRDVNATAIVTKEVVAWANLQASCLQTVSYYRNVGIVSTSPCSVFWFTKTKCTVKCFGV